VLLGNGQQKSGGKPRLPLAASDFGAEGSLAVVGPNSHNDCWGNYATNNAVTVTPLQGIRARVPSLVNASGMPSVASPNTTGAMWDAALAAAKGAKVTVAIFGIDGSQEHETGTRSQVTLPGAQEALLKVTTSGSPQPAYATSRRFRSICPLLTLSNLQGSEGHGHLPRAGARGWLSDDRARLGLQR